MMGFLMCFHFFFPAKTNPPSRDPCIIWLGVDPRCGLSSEETGQTFFVQQLAVVKVVGRVNTIPSFIEVTLLIL
jgi:hypothetical protein